jgi:protein-ribulosamine 3-kinase
LIAGEWQRAVERSLGLDDTQWQSTGASGWGQSFALNAGSSRFFVKTSSGRHASTIDAEANGLAALRSTQTIRVPRVIAELAFEGTQILVLEWLDLGRSRDGAALGAALTALHRAAPPCGNAGERFGWSRDNWIGGSPQCNGWLDDWIAFFVERRLRPQLTLAAKQRFEAHIVRDGERLIEKLPMLLRDHHPQPSLLHGDLWSGNVGVLASGEPVVFDPAVYVGDREADIAMSELFGGFGSDFYDAYNALWPLEPDYSIRRDVYNLYHVLNHLNLFGRGYLAQAQRIVARLLAQTG